MTRTLAVLIVLALLVLPVRGSGRILAAGVPPFAPGSPGPGEGMVPSPLPLPETVSRGVRMVAVDPGHGGKEPGAVGKSGTLEKDLTMALASQAGKALEEAGYRVVYTREDDYFVGLRERTAIANAAGADLFVSIHANASTRADINGYETYYVSFAANDDEAQAMARKENSSLEAAQAAAGASTEAGPTVSGLEAVLWDMAQTEFANQSGEFAARLQKKLSAAVSGRSRGIRQAPLIVLLGARMPAVLVETGFISNAEEELRLKDQDFAGKFARALVQAVNEESQALMAGCAPARAATGAGAEVAAIPGTGGMAREEAVRQ
jgi:N-acetylmuramoyl-L-alanine amidase